MNTPLPFSPLPDYDYDSMNTQQLQEALEDIRQQIAALDTREPRNPTSEAYDLWAERHEALEDIQDDILDLLEDC